MNTPNTVSVDEHQRFQESLTRTTDHFDEIDNAAEHPAQRRKEGETNRLLKVLDFLLVEELRSQAFEETAAREDGASR